MFAGTNLHCSMSSTFWLPVEQFGLVLIYTDWFNFSHLDKLLENSLLIIHVIYVINTFTYSPALIFLQHGKQ